jgi:signal transduction histidine kinase
MEMFGLRRIWVTPIEGVEGRIVAALYLDSPAGGRAFGPDVEERLVAVARHIGLALRNASLFEQVVDLNRTLEARVAERTRELERSQTQLVARDRLATLGRLVAAIAHELNNPTGAIASFAGTLRGIAVPVMNARHEMANLFPDPEDQRAASALLEAAAAAARSTPTDTRARRELEDSLGEMLRSRRVPSTEMIAQRFARAGIGPERLEPHVGLLASHGQVLSELVERVHTFGRSVETIGQCAANVARIVDGLKTYAHLDRAEAEVADVHVGIQATLTVLAPRIPKGIEVVTRFDAIAPFPHHPGELTQVWTNLVDNAVRAMGEGGTLGIETHDEGDHVRVTVSDTGAGVPDQLRDRIFELDVTSRGPGAGLGLGLPICRTIVERRHGGRIAFESRPGRTVFTVVLSKTMARPPESS